MKSLLILLSSSPVILFSQPIVNGWTDLQPSTDSRILYVSVSEGDDGTAVVYSPSDPQIGGDVFEPSGAIQPFATFSQASAYLRSGYPDYILFKRGDVFHENWGVFSFSGRNLDEPMVFGAYGSDIERPLFETGSGELFGINGAPAHYLAFVSLELYPHTRGSADDPNGVSIFAPFRYLLFEDCKITGYFNNFVCHDPDNSTYEDRKHLRVRRCILSDAYTLNMGNSCGMFISSVDSMLWEENLFDHNGWNESITGADLNGFRHNTYFHAESSNLVFRGNISARAAAMGGGHRSGGIIENNLYLKNPKNILFGTFENMIDFPSEVNEGVLRNNVVLDARREVSYSEGGTGVQFSKNGGTTIEQNIFAHQTEPTSGARALAMTDGAMDVTVQNNIVYNWCSNQTGGWASRAMVAYGSVLGNSLVSNNYFQQLNTGGFLVECGVDTQHIDFVQNTYFSFDSPSDWFQPFGSFTNWQTAMDPLGQRLQVNFLDPQRDIESYMNFIGDTGGLEAFLEKASEQSKTNWNDEYTAESVNCYVREGFQRPISYSIPDTITISYGDPATIAISGLNSDVLVQLDENGFTSDTTLTFYPTSSGNHMVSFLDPSQAWLLCSDTVHAKEPIYVEVQGVPVSTNKKSQIEYLLKNPIGESLSIKNIPFGTQIKVYNSMGELVICQNFRGIDIPFDYSSGMYMVQLEHQGSIQTIVAVH